MTLKEFSPGNLLGHITARFKGRFYIYGAILFTLIAIADFAYLHRIGGMERKTFDWIISHRIVQPKPDKDIVIVDIDEASLNAMAQEYGRWPWPRQVLGEFVEHLEEQKPAAIVFDILFSDPDVYNPDSDAYFNNVIAQQDNIYFPMLRLDPASDHLSQIKPDMVPGVTKMPGETPEDKSIAIVLPHFEGAMKPGHLGLHNLYPDDDGKARRYTVYRDDYGWRIPSLPAEVVTGLGYHAPQEPEVLINWPGKVFAYPTASFSDVYDDFLNREKKRPQNEFTGKIVIIGSTAPSLFDIKATPIAKQHPGVEILATAIDNFKNANYLRTPKVQWIYLLISIGMVWGIAWLFYNKITTYFIDRAFAASQIVLLAVTYASLNFSTFYIDLTVPVTVAFLYFSVSRIYAFSLIRQVTQELFASHPGKKGEAIGVIGLIEIRGEQRNVGRVLRRIKRAFARSILPDYYIETFNDPSKRGVWRLFRNMLLFSWRMETGDASAQENRLALDHVKSLASEVAASESCTAVVTVREAKIEDGESGSVQSNWQKLLGETFRAAGENPKK